MRGRAFFCAAVTLCLLLPPPLPVMGQSERSDAEQAIDQLLEERASALLERDRSAFLATVLPGADAFKRRQALLFDRLGNIPLGSLRYEVAWNAYGDLARTSDKQAYPDADDLRIPLTIEHYEIAGYDKRAVVQDLYLTFVRDGDAWFIGNDADLDDIGFLTQRNPWDLGDVALTEGKNIVALSSGCGGAACGGVPELLDAAEGAMEQVDRYWDRPWNRRVPFFAPDDAADLAKIIQATFSVENYVAFAFWTGGAGRSEGARIIADPSVFESAGFDRSFSILAHELTHVATLPYRGSFMPRFLDEGFAQYVQYDAAGRVPTVFDAAVRASGDATLPEDYTFFIGDSGDVQLVYQKSLSAVSFIAERWGEGRVTRLYRAIGSSGGDIGTATHHVDEAFKKVLGMGVDAFEKVWASSIVGL